MSQTLNKMLVVATLLAAPSIATAKSLPAAPNFSEHPSDPPTKLILPLRAGAYAPIEGAILRPEIRAAHET